MVTVIRAVFYIACRPARGLRISVVVSARTGGLAALSAVVTAAVLAHNGTALTAGDFRIGRTILGWRIVAAFGIRGIPFA